MGSLVKKVMYFDSVGNQNTDDLLKRVRKYCDEEGVTNIVLASTTGETGAKAAKLLKGRNLVIVTHVFGFKEPGKSELQTAYRDEILSNGARIFTGTHALSSAERSVRGKFGTIGPLEIIANALRLMGEGTKVCVEITLMAADAGLIPVDKDIVAIGGSSQGADTALLVKPANSARFFELKIREVIAKPRGL